MGRTLLGALLGLVVAVVTIMVIQWAGHLLFPPPPGLDPRSTAEMATLIGGMPTAALWFVVGAWVVGAFDGGFVAALVAGKRRPWLAALAPALLVVAGVVAMMLEMPSHPRWVAVLGLLLPVPVALAGAWLAARLRGAARAGA
jgi:hypothetical protein